MSRGLWKVWKFGKLFCGSVILGLCICPIRLVLMLHLDIVRWRFGLIVVRHCYAGLEVERVALLLLEGNSQGNWQHTVTRKETHPQNHERGLVVKVYSSSRLLALTEHKLGPCLCEPLERGIINGSDGVASCQRASFH